MGVTNRNEVKYKKPDYSSTESLHIPPSNSGSISSLNNAVSTENIPLQRGPARQKRHNRLPIEGPISSPSRYAGKRRQRRYKSVSELSSLMEEDESDLFLESGIPHNSPFTTILENPELEKIWEKFTQEEKEELEMSDSQDPQIKAFTASYSNISFHGRMTFKTMRSLYELQHVENEIVDFFTNTPENCFIKNDKNSYQRLLIHAVAQYYCLKSTSFNADDGTRTIKVENPNNCRGFCNKRLLSIVEDNHKKRL